MGSDNKKSIDELVGEITGVKKVDKEVESRKLTFFKSQENIKTLFSDLIKDYCLHNKVIHLTTLLKFDFRNNMSASLVIMIQFMHQKYIDKNIYKEATEYFITKITKKGRRPWNERNNKDSVTNKVYMSEKYTTIYLNLLYSYYILKGRDLDDVALNKGYFFTDFINFINDNKTDFLNFVPDKE